jgi:hypothetical protein
MKRVMVKTVIAVVFLVALGLGIFGLFRQPCTAGDCCATKNCSAGWHCCNTANGGCGCFLDAQGPCPR